MTKLALTRPFAILAGVLFIACGLEAPASAADYANPRLLVSTNGLESLLGRPDVRVVDVRPKTAYAKGHIPGAVHLSADAIIDPNSPVDGALRPRAQIVEMLETHGIGKDTRVVLYDDRGGFHASRLFWMLEYFGHRKASVLNGGFPKWQKERRRISTTTPRVKRTTFVPTLTPRKAATADWLLDRKDDASVVVIDVRPGKLFKAGHIPWARNIPWSRNLTADATMKPADELLKRFAGLGVTKDKNVAVHCQNGKAAAHSYFTLRLLGFPRVRSYDRSWAEWGAADDLPKARGKRG